MNFSHLRVLLVASAIALVLPSVASAQERHTVRFERGNDNSYVEGTVTGDRYVDYMLGARAGQTMAVSLITDGGAYFNILPPGSTGEAIYNSSIDGNDATNVRLPANGDYTIRVYLMGGAADSGARVPFGLSMAIM